MSNKVKTAVKTVKKTARKAVAMAKSVTKPLVRKAKSATKSVKEVVTGQDTMPVYKQTAGGVAGAIVGGVVAGPIGAVAGAIAGAYMGDRAAHGKTLLPHAGSTKPKTTDKAVKAERAREKGPCPSEGIGQQCETRYGEKDDGESHRQNGIPEERVKAQALGVGPRSGRFVHRGKAWPGGGVVPSKS